VRVCIARTFTSLHHANRKCERVTRVRSWVIGHRAAAKASHFLTRVQPVSICGKSRNSAASMLFFENENARAHMGAQHFYPRGNFGVMRRKNP
jgi:hypothetical protein